MRTAFQRLERVDEIASDRRVPPAGGLGDEVAAEPGRAAEVIAGAGGLAAAQLRRDVPNLRGHRGRRRGYGT